MDGVRKGNGMDVRRATVEELQVQLDQLALDAHENKPGARERYRATLDEIAGLRGDEALRAHAEEQRAVREETQREVQEAERRRQLEARYAEVQAKLRELAPGVDSAAGVLVQRAQAFLQVAEEQYHLERELTGKDRPRLRRGDLIANTILWRLSALPQVGERVGRPDRFYRRPLVELVGEVGAGAASA